jgi:putative tryptophan/tyrosine transport system substrate-binding protein
MAITIGRRELIAMLGGAAVACPLAVRAQQPAMPVIGFLSSRSPDDSTLVLAAFRQALAEAGYVEGRNVAIEFRWAEGRYDRLPALAAELVRRPVTVIAAFAPPAASAAKAATTTIPVVFETGEDPVEAGLVASLSRPGGNVTGVTLFTTLLGAKRLGLLRDLAQPELVGLLVNSTREGATQARDVQVAAHEVGQLVVVLQAGTDREIEAAFAALVERRARALMVGADPFFDTRRDRLIVLAARHAVPTVYHLREFPFAGGLMSYGASIADAYRQNGIYVGRILKGEKAGDLPVVRPTRFELVINLKTAKALALAIPPGVLAIADEVIE